MVAVCVNIVTYKYNLFVASTSYNASRHIAEQLVWSSSWTTADETISTNYSVASILIIG